MVEAGAGDGAPIEWWGWGDVERIASRPRRAMGMSFTPGNGVDAPGVRAGVMMAIGRPHSCQSVLTLEHRAGSAGVVS